MQRCFKWNRGVEIRSVFQQTPEGSFFPLWLQLLFALPLVSTISALGFFSSGKKTVRQSSVSGSCKIHPITAAFPNLPLTNHSPFLYFMVFLIHLYTSRHLPHHPLSHSLSFWPFSVVGLLSCATTHFKFLLPPLYLFRHPDLPSPSATQSLPVLRLCSDETIKSPFSTLFPWPQLLLAPLFLFADWLMFTSRGDCATTVSFSNRWGVILCEPAITCILIWWYASRYPETWVSPGVNWKMAVSFSAILWITRTLSRCPLLNILPTEYQGIISGFWIAVRLNVCLAC